MRVACGGGGGGGFGGAGGGGQTPHDGSLGGAEGSEKGEERWGRAEPALAGEHPSLQTCRRGATMDVTMTLGEEFPPRTSPYTSSSVH